MEFLKMLPNLQTIEARSCGICTINYNYEHFQLRSLRRADFSHNKIDSITKHCFYALREGLRTLNLSSNNINQFITEAFSDLFNLEVLDLSNNVITNIQPTCFKDLLQLKELYFANNQLQILHFQRFSENHNLQILIVSSNHIKNLTFPGTVWKNLTTLDLSYNMINHLDREITAKYFPNLKNLIITDFAKLVQKSERFANYLIAYITFITLLILLIVFQLYCKPNSVNDPNTHPGPQSSSVAVESTVMNPIYGEL
jgi:Leucine-rich repeat (LRR) protein